MFRRVFLGVFPLFLAACAANANLDAEPEVSLGNFKLGHNIVVVDGPEQGPFSRDATDGELKAALEKGIADRFGRYDGDNFYHIGVKLDFYVLAQTGVPVVFTPKSVFVVSVNFWNDSTQELLNEEGGVGFTVFEGLNEKTIISSGLFQSRDKQMEILSANVAKTIENWILENPEWVGLPPTSTVASEIGENAN